MSKHIDQAALAAKSAILRYSFYFFAATGLFCIAAYWIGIVVPLWQSGGIILAATASLIALILRGEIGMLSFLLYSITALPFLPLVPYLFYDWSYSPPDRIWLPGDFTIGGLATNPYSFDRSIVALTALLGAAGLSGLMIGISGYYANVVRSTRDKLHNVLGMHLVLFFVLIAISVGLSEFSAPADTIFTADYKGKGGGAEAANFASTWLISYAILIFCFADSLAERRGLIARVKVSVSIAAMMFIVIWLQFARGDRECVPMILAFGVMFWNWGIVRFANSGPSVWILRAFTVASVTFLLLSGQALQSLRSNMAGRSIMEVGSVLDRISKTSGPVGTSLEILEANPLPSPTPSLPEPMNSSEQASSGPVGTSLEILEANPPPSPTTSLPEPKNSSEQASRRSSGNAPIQDDTAPALVAPAKNTDKPKAMGKIFAAIDDRIPAGTWSSVLLTPLSAAGDALRGLSPIKWGRTYADFLISIPPGFVADKFGYVRPIGSGKGPAVEMRYGQGGTHAVVVPFLNFRMVGVVVILAIWGLLFAWLERRASFTDRNSYTVPKLGLFGLAIAIIPHWIWYGEKILINAVLIGLGLALLYYLVCSRRQSDYPTRVESRKPSILSDEKSLGLR